jgi:aryl-alcohol dehydrogenase-like predicted oxidoreductase
VRRRPFGDTGWSVSEIGIGCSRLGGAFSTDTTPRDELAMLLDAIDAGINFFDTSDMYSHGQSEILLGKALKGRRESVIVATKGGFVHPSSARLLTKAKPLLRRTIRALRIQKVSGASSRSGGRMSVTQDFSPPHLAAAVERSLRRLNTDYVDVYQLHSPPNSIVEAAEYLGVLAELKAQGKIRQFGLAAERPDDIAGFETQSGLRSIQVPFSAIEQRAGVRVIPGAVALGAGIIARSCFGAGLLVGDLPEEQLRERTPDANAILRFRAIAADLGRGHKELALQFNLSVAPLSVTVIGVKAPTQLHDLLREYEKAPLSKHEASLIVGLDGAEDDTDRAS